MRALLSRRDERARRWGGGRLLAASVLGSLVACNGLSGVGDLTVGPCVDCDGVTDSTGGPDAGADALTTARDGAQADATADTSVEGPGGILDPTFGTAGVIETDILADPRAVAVRADGRIVVAGGFQNDLAAVAFTSTGALDMAFGTGGRLERGMGNSSAGNAVAFDSQGRALIGGVSTVVTTVTTRFAYVVRMGATEVDSTFGTNGAWRGAASGEEVRGLVVVSGDGVVVTAADDDDHTFRRLTGAGAPDGTFGTNGKGAVPGVGGEPAGLVALADGFVSGGTGGTGGPSLAAAKVTLTGQPASGFGASGKVVAKVGANNRAAGRAIAAQPDGKVIVAGDYDPDVNQIKRVSVVTRVTAAGAVDALYGAGGIIGGGNAVLDFTELGVGRDTEATTCAVTVDEKGRALVVGTVVDKLLIGGERTRAWVVRLRADGSHDPLFGSQGKLLIGKAPARLEARSAALQADGKLIVVGVNLDKGNLFVARVVTSTTL